jgi:hypothetical protein
VDTLIQFLRGTILRIAVATLPPWIFPPTQREPFEWAGSIPTPAIGTTATVIQFTVPQARNGTIVRLANATTNGNFIDGGGALVWMILQNGVPIENFENIVNQLGLVQAPSEVSSIEVRAQDLIQLTVTNVSLPPTGLIGGRLGGWYYPQNLERKGSFAA